MAYSSEQLARESLDAMKKTMRKLNTPAKARAFLIKCGIIERHKGSPNGVRLTKHFR
jgi:hypothetical protein